MQDELGCKKADCRYEQRIHQPMKIPSQLHCGLKGRSDEAKVLERMEAPASVVETSLALFCLTSLTSRYIR